MPGQNQEREKKKKRNRSKDRPLQSQNHESEVKYGEFGCVAAGTSGKCRSAISESDSGSFAAGGDRLRRQIAGSERRQIRQGASLDISQYRVCVVGDSARPGDFEYRW